MWVHIRLCNASVRLLELRDTCTIFRILSAVLTLSEAKEAVMVARNFGLLVGRGVGRNVGADVEVGARDNDGAGLGVLVGVIVSSSTRLIVCPRL